MVKIPSFEDLKKAGANLVDSAKQVKFNEMVDKLKTGIESVGSSLKKDAVVPQGDDVVKNQFKSLYTSLNELTQLFATQAAVLKNIENQISTLGKIVEAKQTLNAGVKATDTLSSVESQPNVNDEKKP